MASPTDNYDLLSSDIRYTEPAGSQGRAYRAWLSRWARQEAQEMGPAHSSHLSPAHHTLLWRFSLLLPVFRTIPRLLRRGDAFGRDSRSAA